jgi:hypothetical protein
MNLYQPTVSGSLVISGSIIVSGSVNATQGITASFSGNATSASFATNAATAYTASSISNLSQNVQITGSLGVTSTITAQTLNVQTVTSSIVFSSGSNIFGNQLTNTQQFTGSVNVTGSLNVVTTGTELRVTGSGVSIGNALTDSHTVSGSLSVNPGGLFVSSSGNVGIGTTDPTQLFVVSGNNTAGTAVNIINTSSGGYNWNIFSVGSAATLAPVGSLAFRDSTNGVTRMVITSEGNVGIGITPPTTSNFSHLFVGRSFTVFAGSGNDVYFGQNFYYNGGFKARYSEPSALISTSNGDFIFNNSSTGTADATLTTSEKMRITSGGNVGIGATNITGKFMIYQGTAGNVFQSIVSNQGGSTRVGINLNPSMNESDVAAYQAQSAIYATDFNYSANIIFATKTEGAYGNALTERMRITSGGNVGIGVTSPSYKFHTVSPDNNTTSFAAFSALNLSQQVEMWYGGIRMGGSNTHVDMNLAAKGSAGVMNFITNGSTRMQIDGSGNIGAPSGTNIYNASDLRLKRNISTINDGLNKIMELNPVKFNWIENYVVSEENKDMLGFIAQEIQEVIPEAVESFANGNTITIGETLIENPLRVNEKFIIPVLVKAIQEQQTQIEELKAIIERNNLS